MGRFFSNIQVKTDLNKDEFIKKLVNALVCYEACGKDEAEISFRAAFSERYATFTRSEYGSDPDMLKEDAQMLSAALKTSVFTVTVADSDFAELSLFTDGQQKDDVVVGDGEDYGVEENPASPPQWQPLLKSGAAFGELAAVWEKREVFVEDALANSAPLFGIEPQFMLAEFEELNDENSTALYFKKNSSAPAISMEEKPDIVTVFDSVFEAALSPRGFCRFKKGSFVRVIGGEILQVIEYHNTSSGKRKSFTVCARMLTVYESTNRDQKRGFFHPVPYLCRIYESQHPERYIDETYNKMSEIRYDPNDSADMTRAVREALEYTTQIALPKYDRVTDLPSYLLVSTECGSIIWVSTIEKCREPNWLRNAGDELLYVKTRYGGDFLELLDSEESYNKMIAAVKARNFTPIENPYPSCDEPYSKHRDECIQGAAKLRGILDKAFTDKEFCALIEAELERRKTENVKALAKLGIEV